jgi:hypothetical protein
MFTLLPQDKANHEVYGARIAGITAVLVVFAASVAASAYPVVPPFASLAAAVAALLAATAAGVYKEYMDKRANDTAEEQGLAMPHDVSTGDIRATVIGGLSVSVPMFALWVLR